MNPIRSYGPSVLLLLAVVGTMLLGPTMVRQIAYAQTDARISLVQDSLSQNPFLAELSDSFRKVAQVVEPSVVHIQVSKRAAAVRGGGSREDMLRRWFFGPNAPDASPYGERPEPREMPDGSPYDRYNPSRPTGNGSGWVYDSQGHIITNNHVIQDADEITVRFFDGSEREATVVGTDPNTDIAVIKVSGETLHPAAIAPQPVEQGDIVFAFGSPFRFEFSMSQGIVSAKGRQLRIIGDSGYENFIQTDAAVNPGNSGGPLTNIYGQVVGMNTAIATRTGASNGLGFAIPVNMVTDVADQLLDKGEVTRGYLGILIDDLDPAMARTFGFEGDGVLVVEPTPDSPAADAGVQAGDIITHVQGEPVTTADQLRFKVAGYAPGTDVTVTVFRDGEAREITVTLGELPSQGIARAVPEDRAEPGTDAAGMETLRKLGVVAVEPFTPELADRLGADHQPGVVVTEVRPGSVAAVNGFSRGTLITSVMGRSVDSPQALTDTVKQHDPTQGIRFRVGQWDPSRDMFIMRFVLLEIDEP